MAGVVVGAMAGVAAGAVAGVTSRLAERPRVDHNPRGTMVGVTTVAMVGVVWLVGTIRIERRRRAGHEGVIAAINQCLLDAQGRSWTSRHG